MKEHFVEGNVMMPLRCKRPDLNNTAVVMVLLTFGKFDPNTMLDIQGR